MRYALQSTECGKLMPLMSPNRGVRVVDYLRAFGPMTLADLALQTGLSQQRLRDHLKLHNEVFQSYIDDSGGAKVRMWHVVGEYE